MSEEVNDSVEELDGANQGIAEPTEAESHDERREEAAQARKRSDAEFNFAEMRRKQELIERQNYEMRLELERLKSPVKQEEPDNDEDLATLGATKKVLEREFERKFEQKFAQVKRQLEAETVDDRLSAKYSDFSEVLTNDNIEFLKETQPELAASIYANPDPYKQALAAYKLIKMVKGPDMKKAVPVEKKRAEANLAKPVSSNAAAKSATPLGQAHVFENGLTPDLRKQLWREMEQARKGA